MRYYCVQFLQFCVPFLTFYYFYIYNALNSLYSVFGQERSEFSTFLASLICCAHQCDITGDFNACKEVFHAFKLSVFKVSVCDIRQNAPLMVEASCVSSFAREPRDGH